jgi:hypothetical protein
MHIPFITALILVYGCGFAQEEVDDRRTNRPLRAKAAEQTPQESRNETERKSREEDELPNTSKENSSASPAEQTNDPSSAPIDPSPSPSPSPTDSANNLKDYDQILSLVPKIDHSTRKRLVRENKKNCKEDVSTSDDITAVKTYTYNAAGSLESTLEVIRPSLLINQIAENYDAKQRLTKKESRSLFFGVLGRFEFTTQDSVDNQDLIELTQGRFVQVANPPSARNLPDVRLRHQKYPGNGAIRILEEIFDGNLRTTTQDQYHPQTKLFSGRTIVGAAAQYSFRRDCVYKEPNILECSTGATTGQLPADYIRKENFIMAMIKSRTETRLTYLPTRQEYQDGRIRNVVYNTKYLVTQDRTITSNGQTDEANYSFDPDGLNITRSVSRKVIGRGNAGFTCEIDAVY